MKPLPEAVQHAFPCAPGRLPDRPWWRHGTVSWGMKVVHRNDAPFQAQQYEHIVDRDTAHPLPHPGYRAGQVWAAEDGDSVVVVAISGGLVCTAYDEEGWRPSTFSRAYPYLMFDGACPHLAPWSPAEKTP